MIPMISNEVFKATLRRCLENKKMSISGFAKVIGKPRETVSNWLNSGIKKDITRAKVVASFPQIWGNPNEDEALLVSTVSSKTILLNDMLVLVKTEQARMLVQNLSSLLEWFILNANKEERNTLRTGLGPDWTRFLELSRSMTNEMALKVAIDEGRLNWLKQ